MISEVYQGMRLHSIRLGVIAVVGVAILLSSYSAFGQSRTEGNEGPGEVEECDPPEDGALFGILPGTLAGVLWLARGAAETPGAGMTAGQKIALGGVVGAVVGLAIDGSVCHPSEPEDGKQESSLLPSNPTQGEHFSIPQSDPSYTDYRKVDDLSGPFISTPYHFPASDNNVEVLGGERACDPSWDGALWGVLPGALAGGLGIHMTQWEERDGLEDHEVIMLWVAVGALGGLLIDAANCNPMDGDDSEEQETTAYHFPTSNR